MNSKKFSEAMSELDNKYVDEAINYKKKAQKPGWIKWGALAACLCLVICAIAIPNLLNNTDGPRQGAGNFISMIYVNNTLYQRVDHKDNLADKESEFVYLGKIESRVDESQEPTKNFQTNDDIMDAPVYQYGEDIVVLVDGEYLLYSAYNVPVRGGVTPDETQPCNVDTDNTESCEPAQNNF